jgi:opacity protein-like surface antigen
MKTATHRATAGTVGFTAIFLSSVGAIAQDRTPPTYDRGYYVTGGAGLNFLEDAATPSTTYQYDTGGMGLGAFGYQFGNGFRVEGELAYRASGVSGTTNGGASGEASAASLMANAFYDIRTSTKFTPYVGAGIGGAVVTFDNVTIPGSSNRIDDSDLAIAYQAMAGVAYQLEGNLKLDVGYRYFATESPRFQSANGTEIGSHYHDHAAVISLRYEFGEFSN